MSDEEELTTEDRVSVVSKYILQAPPGEINDVVNDVRLLLDDDALFQSLLPSALKEYHQSQFTAVEVPGQSYHTIISPSALLPVDPPTKYFEPRSSQTFEFDPVKLTTSSFEPLPSTIIPESTSTFLSTIQPLLQTYITNHFTTGTGSVFPTFKAGPPPPPAPAPLETPDDADIPVVVVPIDSKEEDPIVETALVETADEVVEVAKEVEEELKIETENEQEEREEKKAAAAEVEDGTWEEEEAEEEGDKMKGVEEPVKKVEVKEEEMEAPTEETEVVAEEVKEEEESKEMEVEASVVAKEEEEQEPEAAAVVEPEPEPEVVEEVPEVPAGPNVEIIEGKYTIVTSGYRYSPANFWTGRWRSSYSIDVSQDTFTGTIEVVVHYYEQGNVQLRTTQTPTLTLPSSNASPKDIIAAIGKAERAAQEGINGRLEELADKAFKSLRRALPVTRQKMEWEKVGGYKLGGAIGGGTPRGEVEAQV